jgi:hypothetical protein
MNQAQNRYYQDRPDSNQQQDEYYQDQQQDDDSQQGPANVGAEPIRPMPRVAMDPKLTTMRPAVRNVVLALRAMPPQAREREIASGKYDGISQHEWRTVRASLNVSAGGAAAR